MAAGRTGRQELAARLLAAVTPEEVLEIVADLAGALVGARMVNISLLDDPGDTLRLITSRQTSASVKERFATYPVAAPLPSRDALATGLPVLLSGLAERDRRYPALIGERAQYRAFAVLPLLGKERALGVLAFGWTDEQSFPVRQVAGLEDVAFLCASALGRAALYRQEQQARAAAERVTGRLRELQTLSVQLAQATEPAHAADLVASTISTVLGADAATISAFDGARTFTVLAVHGLPPEQITPGATYTPDDAPLTRVLLGTQGPASVTTFADWDPRYPVTADTVDGSGSFHQVWVVLPLRVDAAVVGLASFGWRDHRQFDVEDMDFLTAVASHAAIALDRAKLLGASRAAAETLQRALMPQIIKRLPGWDVAAHYAPAVEGTRVGGDWYDAFALPSGKIGLALGDVTGKGVRAAAVMGAVRSALRAFATLDPTPSVVLAELDAYFAIFKREELVTCCYSILDPATGHLSYATAGHPPPLLIKPDDGVRWLDRANTPLLGVRTDIPRRHSEVVIADNEVLLLYSDGLVERRHQPMSTCLEALADASTLLTSAQDLQSAVDALVEDLDHPDRTIDDIAVLALRRLPATSLDRDPVRDRDVTGRPRQSRPRDVLGRPLPYGDPHGVEPVPEDPLPPERALALAQSLLDDGRAFSAHEVLEAAWKAAPSPERDLWQGLAQICVGITHAQRGNAIGASRLIRRGADRLRRYEDDPPQGIDVAGLVTWCEQNAASPASGPPIQLRRDRGHQRAEPDRQ
jgi:serine phosphatase RsbU (regulator of sigma subunit)